MSPFVGVIVIVPVEAPSGSPEGLAWMVRVAEVVPEPDATKLVPVVVAVSHAELDANVNP